MRPLFHPSLINDPFGDPGLYIDCLHERRALLFDLGDLRNLATRKLLRVSDVFVSHAHMDHFIGFDWLLRICLGRSRRIRLYGPPGFIAQVEHRLAAYTWNLVDSYETDLTFEVTELVDDSQCRAARFRCQAGFRRGDGQMVSLDNGVLLDEQDFRVRCTVLDHKTPCLAFALEEKEHINVWKNRLDELGLPTGPWLTELRHAVRAGRPESERFRVWWKDRTGLHERFYLLGELKREILRFVPGQRVVYVTDAVFHAENVERITALAAGADVLFIEATFLQADRETAAARFHLTAEQAGELARRAGAKNVVPFHGSPRYQDTPGVLFEELMRAYTRGTAGARS
ncbi:MAG: ribonuclease Z [Pseudomonadota bacterium]|nr:MAG: ribonuclease Z [Pseudomonadota bacterium]